MCADLPSGASPSPYDETIVQGGFRLTKQRRVVYDALMETLDHPTAVQVFMRVQKRLPSISLATVYNCLETMSQCGLVRQVNFDRGPSRFCANPHRHGHFICTGCGAVHDVEVPDPAELTRVWQLPEDCVVNQYEFSLRGLCRQCTQGVADESATISTPSKPTT